MEWLRLGGFSINDLVAFVKEPYRDKRGVAI